MKVVSITPRGYCKGVSQAIKVVRDAVSNHSVPKPIHVLGYIVHNHYVIEELSKLGVITHDDSFKSRLEIIDEIESGTVVLSAHGTDPSVRMKLESRGLNCIDATCEDVEKTFQLIKHYSSKGYYVIYIGKANHPEAKAATSLVQNISLVESIKDIPQNLTEPLFVTNQTTFSHTEINKIIDTIKKKYPNTLVSEEICNATSLRQKAVITHNKNVDLCYIVGDPRSNNTRNLAIISESETRTKTFLIESIKDINSKDLIGISTVSVSSGASTPDYLTREVIDYLKNFPDVK